MIPTLAADAVPEECLRSLEAQTWRDFEVIVVDNSGKGLARRSAAARAVRVLENDHNVGFGAAINQGLRASSAPLVAALNDDAAAWPGWLAALAGAMATRPDAGMCASQVRLAGVGLLDSAGMLICADGTSKQRGHREPPEKYAAVEEVLLPSACAALYRRTMLEEIGGFDEDFFLFAEDTDVGLRARWAGWTCIYAPEAVVDHRYSHSTGPASPLKAYYVERNRLFLIVKNFPAGALMKAPLAMLARYFWHVAAIVRGRGAAARFRAEGNSGWRLALCALRAHLALAAAWGSLWRKRRVIRRGARIGPAEFRGLLRQYSITARNVAAQ